MKYMQTSSGFDYSVFVWGLERTGMWGGCLRAECGQALAACPGRQGDEVPSEVWR